jgi:hypothetical protein
MYPDLNYGTAHLLLLYRVFLIISLIVLITKTEECRELRNVSSCNSHTA